MRYTDKGPLGYYYEEIEIGQKMVTQGRTITEADVVNFGNVVGDFNPLHFDAEYMKNHLFGKRIAHGMLTLSFATGLGNQLGAMQGTILAFRGLEITFEAPVYIGDTIRLETVVTKKKDAPQFNAGWVTQEVKILNQDNVVCQQGRWTTLIACQPKEDGA